MLTKVLWGAGVLAILALAVVLRVGAVTRPLIDFDADEAVVGIMAQRILQGHSWPIFYAGQGYLGAVEAWGAALVFLILGEEPGSLRLVPFGFTLAFLVVQWFLLRRFFPPPASWLILLWTALGSPYLNLWGVKARGGFAETCFFASVFLLMFDQAWRGREKEGPKPFWIAAVAGFGYFINPLMGTLMMIPIVLLLIAAWKDYRPLLSETAKQRLVDLVLFRGLPARLRLVFRWLALPGLVLGLTALTLLISGDIVVHDPTRIKIRDGTRLAGQTTVYFLVLYLAELVVLYRPSRERIQAAVSGTWQCSAGIRLLTAISAGIIVVSALAKMGAYWLDGGGYERPFRLAALILWPERVRLVFGEIIPDVFWHLWGLAGITLAGFCVIVVLLFTWGRQSAWADYREAPNARAALTLFGGSTLAIIVLVTTSEYTIDASASRYFVPLLVCLPATLYLAIGHLTGSALRLLLVAAITVSLAIGVARAPSSILHREPARPAISALLEELESQHGVRRVIGDYWTVYPVAFLSKGRIAATPLDGRRRFPEVSRIVCVEGPDAYVFRTEAKSLAAFRSSPQAEGLVESVLKPAGSSQEYRIFYLDHDTRRVHRTPAGCRGD